MVESLSATLHTNRGDVVLQLFPDHAPKTVRNFTELAEGTKEWTDPRSGKQESGRFYDGLGFHRVIGDFMIQGGCPLGTGTGGPGYTFDDEISPDKDFTSPYMVAMANAGKRMGKGTNGSQFFITVGPATWLHGKHTIFGEVSDGSSREVLDSMAAVHTGRNDRPVEPITIERVTVQQ